MVIRLLVSFAALIQIAKQNKYLHVLVTHTIKRYISVLVLGLNTGLEN